jgi:hypothetical protein
MDDTKKVKKDLEVSLTHAEWSAYSETLAIEVQNVYQLRQEKKAFDKRMGDAIKEKEDEVAEVVKKVATKKELREVECMWEYDWNRNTKTLLRLDTFEQVEERVIDPKERQLYLDGIEKAKEEAAEKESTPDASTDQDVAEHTEGVGTTEKSSLDVPE